MGAAGDARLGVSEGGVPGGGSQALGLSARPDEIETSLALHAAEAGSLGQAWTGRIEGRTKAQVGQEVALDSNRDGVASKGPFPPWEYPAGQREGRGLQAGHSGRVWNSVSPLAGPREIPGGTNGAYGCLSSGAQRSLPCPQPRAPAPYPPPQAEILRFPALSALSFHG